MVWLLPLSSFRQDPCGFHLSSVLKLELAPRALRSRMIAGVDCPNPPTTRLVSNEIKTIAGCFRGCFLQLKVEVLTPPVLDLGLTVAQVSDCLQRAMLVLAGTPAILPLHDVSCGRGFRAPVQHHGEVRIAGTLENSSILGRYQRRSRQSR